MKKYNYALFFILLTLNSVTMPLINRGYTELDRLFGFPVESVERDCRSCYKPRCHRRHCYRNDCPRPGCRPKRFSCYRNNCRWEKIFHILSSYGIDPNTYFLKTPYRETLLDLAVREGNINAMRTLIDKYNMNITDEVFIAAMENNQREALRFLLDSRGVPTVVALNYAYDSNIQWAMDMFADYGFRI